MVKHIVMWKIKSSEMHTSTQIIQDMKQGLEALVGQIEGLMMLEVGDNYNSSEAAYDVVLVSEFESKQALEYYQSHPKHVEAGNTLVKPYTTARVVVDYEF